MSDLQAFIEQEVGNGLNLTISHLSYYPFVRLLLNESSVREARISYVPVDASLALNREGDKLFGTLEIRKVLKEKGITPVENRGLAALNDVMNKGPREVLINRALNYVLGEKVSIYSGDVPREDSWSFHCDLSKK